MKMWMTAAVTCAAMLGATCATAQTPSQAASPDPRGDRIVTRNDAAAQADRRFAVMDANGDGKLTRDERRISRGQRHQPVSTTADGDNKGAGSHRGRDADQTQGQFRERALHRFDRIDTNHDGRIDQREREAMRLLMRARRAGGDAAPSGAGAPR
ncbi:hypothetical protein ASE95_15175 [Sphingomonas sp. Leaf231]|uniref:hypothetical protein n=1 Tax=Sphingomonas sp. Leaf231 TaxID=1736301 RepID=UPI0006F253C9|nr:hypothetical protein [Sphingomonas sp. Leaf231]KQN90054.1 hypothetical protein ASE95_15175 [Sphingomonas sp. Leaf231]